MGGACVLLRDLIDREVRHVNIGAQSRLERSTNVSQLVPDDTPEKGMILNLIGAAVLAALVTDAVLGVAQEAGIK